jgi:hypothetical protein
MSESGIVQTHHDLRGQLGGGSALEIESFLGPVKWRRAKRRVPFGAQKLEAFKHSFHTFRRHIKWVK